MSSLWVSRLIGAGLVLVVHGSLLVVTALQPDSVAHTEDPKGEMESCANVVSPACATGAGGQATELDDAMEVQPRRCPEPMRRVRRREPAPPPPASVDLLVAELVENFGEVDGNAFGAAAAAKPNPAQGHKRVKQVRKLVGSKLDNILAGGAKGEERRAELGKILGTSKGKKGGDATISRKGSAYARTLKRAVLSHFRVPGNVPPWLRKSLICRVKIVTMTATGRIISYRVVRKSGNAAFDGAVRGLMNGYKAGLRALPAPPAHILSAINSRGFTIDFR